MNNIIKVLFISLIISTSTHAQEVDLRKEKVSIDGVEVFNYKIDVAKGWMSIYDIKTNDELIYIEESDNETKGNYDDDYTIFKFLKQNVVVEISGYGFWIDYIKYLLRNKVFDKKGTLNDSKIELFKTKFDENITKRTNKN